MSVSCSFSVLFEEASCCLRLVLLESANWSMGVHSFLNSRCLLLLLLFVLLYALLALFSDELDMDDRGDKEDTLDILQGEWSSRDYRETKHKKKTLEHKLTRENQL